MTVLGDGVYALYQKIQHDTRDINRTAIRFVDMLESQVLFPRALPFRLRGKLEKHFVEGFSEARLAKAIDMIVEEFPDLA